MRKFISAEWKSFSNSWSQFWFESASDYKLALFRSVVAGIAFVFYFIRIFDFHFLYSNQGFLPYSDIQSLVPEFVHGLIRWEFLLQNDQVSFALHILLLLLLLALFLGALPRPLFLLLLIIHWAFHRRNPYVLYGADMVLSYWLLYLSFTKTNHYFSVIPKALRKLPSKSDKVLNSVALRLLQIQLCIVYAYSGLEKAKGVTWWQGDAIWFALANSQIVSFDYSFMAYLPVLVVFATFTTLLWEIYFPFAVWIPALKRYVLLLGLVMHILIAVSMNLWGFSFLMLSVYILFLKERDLQSFTSRIGIT